ncbi:MAG: hypothetical protein IJF88_02480 [Oscillospiraceae bacterium]|nr:hypothetical protein [Oscillospiraceae bacterium]MBQ2633432.1 hypothetical protein [Oscillospiraceae bacterium]
MSPQVQATLIPMAGYLIAAVASILVAVIEVRGQRERKRSEARAERRERESRLSMDLMIATSEMCDVLCIALQGGKVNGNVEAARRKGTEARAAYRDFLADTAAHQVAKY